MNQLTKIVCILFLCINGSASAQDAASILERSLSECRKLTGGSYTLAISKKAIKDETQVNINLKCDFLKTYNDSGVAWKFVIRSGSGVAALCTGNDFVQVNSDNNTGIIYSRNINQSDFDGATQSEGLFPPFFMSQTIFSINRLRETTMVTRKESDESVDGKSCYKIHVIDLVRFSGPNPQKAEKVFLIDKQSYLPLEYTETSTIRIGTDSLIKMYRYRLSELNTKTIPHDSTFTYRNIPDSVQLNTSRGAVYHHHLKTGIKAPPFREKIVGSDSTFSIPPSNGKNVLLYFFSRSSYPSLKALSAIQNYQDENKNIQVLLIGVDVGARNLSELMVRRNISMKAIANGRSIADDYFITSTPAFIAIDNKGMITKIQTGFGKQTVAKLRNN